MFAFETILFELARLFLWPVTLGAWRQSRRTRACAASPVLLQAR